MSRIYEKSVITFVWLGLPSEDRRQARCLEFMAEMARSARKYTQVSPSSYHALTMFAEEYLNDRLTHRWMNLLELCRGTYWTRTWIIQEFVQASHLEVLCGMASLNWKDFEDVVRILRSIIQTSTTMTQPTPLPPFLQQFTQTIPFRLTSRRIGHTASSLEDLLSEFYDSRCAERRDKVYGILGIADDCRGPDDDSDDTANTSYRGPLQPDYSKHILEVYFEVFKYLMQSSTARTKSPMQAMFLTQRALSITQADIESYMALLTIHNPSSKGDAEDLLQQRLAELDLSLPLAPDYVNFVDEVLPGWTSIRDLRQRLEQVDWAKYVGHEVRRKSSRPSSGPHRSSNTSTTSTGAGAGYVRAPLPSDLIDSVINTATHSEEIQHLYNYPCSSAGGCTVPIPHTLFHAHDKRSHNNTSLLKPSIIIESNQSLGIDPVRIGFACTDVRAGDLLCQFTGLDLTLIARRTGSGHQLSLIGLAKMCTHNQLNEKGVHPSCKKHEHGNWSSVLHDDNVNGNAHGWTMVTDPIGVWEVLRHS